MRFADICGHENAITQLKNAVSSGRLGHAYLFHGPQGIGKREVALAFAAYLNCPSNNGADSCGVCRDCETANAGTHHNIFTVWPTIKEKGDDLVKADKPEDGLIRIPQIRELQNLLKHRAGHGKKAVIVEGAERFMPQAANAFLKTLEEPPPDSVIMLIASRPSELLPTMLSRCQRLGFKPLAHDALKSYLIERLEIAPTAASAASRFSAGSIGSALAYLKDGAGEGSIALALRAISVTLKDADGALKIADELAKRDDLIEVLEFFKIWCRDRAVAGAGCPELAVNAEAAGFPAEFRELYGSYEAITEAIYDITPPRYANRLLTMEAMMLRLAGCNAGQVIG
ncbi:MAG: DNA polymerase III subunit [Deltaproteobacteria bacterium]|nr:DNA polymerase III subunit [Deltaproteobacteria bacterium]